MDYAIDKNKHRSVDHYRHTTTTTRKYKDTISTTTITI